jgi:hypothetical protein
LFRRLFLDKLSQAHQAGDLRFFADHAALADPQAFANWLKPLRQQKWYLYAKRPFAGPEAVLAYLSRYTHRVAIANSRLVALTEQGVTFKWKDYREKGHTRCKTMTLDTDEFIRRFLIHVLPRGFHRIRHYGWLCTAGTTSRARTMMSLITIFRQNAIPDCRRRSTAVLLCLAAAGCRRIARFLIPTTLQRQRKDGYMELPNLTLAPAGAVLPSSGLAGQVQIPIVAQHPEHQTTVPAVSYFTAYPTPAR